MLTSDILSCDYPLTTTNYRESTEEIEMETIGDRVQEILRKRGRDDRNEPYEQWELVAMLNGKMTAPNGQRYRVPNANKSTISKMINGNQRWQLEIISAICLMFEQDANWLFHGEAIDVESTPQQFISDEANEAGAIIDRLDPDLRDAVMQMIRSLQSVNNERRALQRSVTSLLVDGIPNLNPNDQIRARSILNKIDSSGLL